MKMVVRRTLAGVILLPTLGLASTLRGQSSSPVRYFYDAAGRLVKVVHQNGNVASYQYDALGNLLSITRSALPGNNGLAILSFTPQQAGMSASGVLALTRRTNCIQVVCARHHSSDDSLPV
jgi:YD repeat-containing protein